MATSDTVHFLASRALIESSFYFAGIAVLFYDYFLTLDREIQYVWRKKLRPVDALFFVCRYSQLLTTIPIILNWALPPGWRGDAIKSDASCAIVTRVQVVLNLLVMCSAALFSAIRIYAIYDKRVVPSIIIFILGLINPAITTYCLIHLQTSIYRNLTTSLQFCGGSDGSHMNAWMMGARASSVVADGLILGLTWIKIKQVKDAQGEKTIRASLTMVLWADTTIYFGLLLLVNIVGIGTGRISDFFWITLMWTPVLTSIILSRLLLDLRETGELYDDQQAAWCTSGNIIFAKDTDSDDDCRTLDDIIVNEHELSTVNSTFEPYDDHSIRHKPTACIV
ncbi:uncharacterized protein LAESUDRAFT_728771 [Laetiporus sulphureus 93-53]|uniref:DUF6533 domain-containing protein n=1 Tax=Laetiporus sulphureus 93-53 TaxID=1314785 RepID=A0A165CYH3_9APHY|nr:uncharacterized protein LAESUDRAFT_728771 [Laetiporus sulphureus 93-53]KZT03750.1 hypothetical protein LAESUDRAFT_728771 [Laetiporus sulphureus 93-53]